VTELTKILRSVVDQEPAFLAEVGSGFCTARMIEERWEHRDFPRMSLASWQTIQVILHDHYSTLSFARYPSGEVRGQIMGSPEGIRLMRERASAHSQ